jgi:hypothetical protein
MTEQWKRSVDARLREIGKTRAWLAEQVGARKSAITTMLGSKQRVSGLVDTVCRVLEIEPPTIGVPAGLVEEAIDLLRALPEEEQQHFVAILRGMQRR